MKGYKGFDKDWKCRGKQYAAGRTETEEDAALCKSGLHFCTFPLDCFAYYPPASSRYGVVEAEDVSGEQGEDSKRAAKRLTVIREIGLEEMIEDSVRYILEKAGNTEELAANTGDRSAATNKGNRSAATNTGYQSAATNTGDWSAATNTGNWSAATNTGNWSAATNTGDRSAATNTGYRSAATNTGDWSAATNTGYRSAATNTGYRSAATNTGDRSTAAVSGKSSVAISTGRESKAKGALGCGIVLCEYDGDGRLAHIAARIVDGVEILPDTYYTLRGGKLVQAEEDEP